MGQDYKIDIAIEWLDSGREPQSPPDPAYPDGIDIDISKGEPSCMVALPYPAKRCGIYSLKCRRCGALVAITTAGRPDDPRSATIACMPREGTH